MSPLLSPLFCHDFRQNAPSRLSWLRNGCGYGGNGVMYSAQAGRRMAQMIAGKGQYLDLPIFTSQLPGHGVLTPFRRLGQRMMYGWYWLQDEKL